MATANINSTATFLQQETSQNSICFIIIFQKKKKGFFNIYKGLKYMQKSIPRAIVEHK